MKEILITKSDWTQVMHSLPIWHNHASGPSP